MRKYNTFHIPRRHMSTNERRLGRFLREGEHTGAAESGTTPNNEGGNSTPNPGESTPANNGGQQFDPMAFWNPAPAGEGGAPGEQTGSAASPTPPENPHADLGKNLGETLQGMTYATPVIDQSVAAEMAEGKYDSFNERMTQMGRDTARQTLAMSLTVMRAVRDQIMAEVNGQLSGTLSTRDNDAALVVAIPSAANPKVAPMVKGIFAQAMKVSNGNREAALSMTKEMLKMSNQEFLGDSSLGIPARTPSDQGSPTAVRTNWIEELVGRE
jgi:hypothetical protein